MTTPWLGRLSDRNGQRPVLLLALTVHSLGLSGLILAVQLQAPIWTLLAAAAVAGASVMPIGSLVRARWAALVTNMAIPGSTLRQAYGLESVLDEVLFVVGPFLVAALAFGLFPAAGLLAVLVLVTIGTLGLATNSRTAPSPVRDRSSGKSSAIAIAGMRVLVLTFVGLGIIFGSIEVALLAFAKERDSSWAAGVLISLFTVGSLVAGFIYGARDWRGRPERRFALAVAWLFLGTVPILLSGSVSLMALSVTLAGIAIAPAAISSSTLLTALLPRSAITEGFAWFSTATIVGGAVGTAAAGWAVDHHGARPAFFVTFTGGAMALVAVLVGARHVRSEPVYA